MNTHLKSMSRQVGIDLPGGVDLARLMRDSLVAHYPRHHQIDYASLYLMWTGRAATLWREEIVPSIGTEVSAAFEQSLKRVRMPAEQAIPWIIGFGYAFGMACHTVADGRPDRRESGAVAAAMEMLVYGLVDHLLDEYPKESAGVEAIFDFDALDRWAHDGNLSRFDQISGNPITDGVVRLHRAVLASGLALPEVPREQTLIAECAQILRRTYEAEQASLQRKMAVTGPTQDLIKQAEETSTFGFQALAVIACLGEGKPAWQKVERFAHDFGRLTWLVDDVSDIEQDKRKGVWSGLAVRLALEAKSPADVERMVRVDTEECGRIITEIAPQLRDVYCRPGDPYSLMDVLWAYIWVWLGGDPQASISKEPMTVSHV